ncbi:MAG: HAD family phosphatase [Chlamydiales bacterium]|nr:HAD family phosphatase [Chlamydiales bacterium]
MSAIQAIFFDFDGVLLDLEPIHYKAWSITLEKEGYTDPDFTLNKVIGVADWDIARNFILKFHFNISMDDLLKRKQQEYHLLIQHDTFDTTEVQSVLEQLKSCFLLAIVSSSLTEDITLILKKQNLQSYFSFIIGGESTSLHKPEPDPYLKALEKSKLHPSQAIVIEDSEAGLLAASRAHLKAIWFNRYQVQSTPFLRSFTKCSCFAKLPDLLQ